MGVQGQIIIWVNYRLFIYGTEVYMRHSMKQTQQVQQQQMTVNKHQTRE